MTKKLVISEIARIAGVSDPGTGVGSSVYKILFNELCVRFDLETRGSMPQQAQRIVTAANLPYDASQFDSRLTPSEGGSTVTLLGLEQIKRATEILVRRQ